VQVDGNDVFAVREVVGEALEAARDGAGPSVIEALTYRLSDHTTADDAGRYRSAEEVKEAWAREPLIRIRRFLVDGGLWDAAKERALLEECTLKVDAAVAEYLAKAKPATDAMFDHLFATLPAHLSEQRLIARKYAKPSGH
jgi:pyruvate dehydrogenase E1 component alpha subunit